MKRLALLLCLLLCGTATAQPLVLPQMPTDGTYVLTVKNGVATSLEKATVLQVGPVVPVDPVDPVDPDLSPDAQAIKAAAEGAVADPSRSETAANLAEVMGMLKSQVDGGTLKTYQQISAAANWLMDSIIGKQTGAWKPVKDLVGQKLAALGQEGAMPEEYSGYFADAADGLEASIVDDEMLGRQRINIEQLMKLFEFFIKYILPFIL